MLYHAWSPEMVYHYHYMYVQMPHKAPHDLALGYLTDLTSELSVLHWFCSSILVFVLSLTYVTCVPIQEILPHAWKVVPRFVRTAYFSFLQVLIFRCKYCFLREVIVSSPMKQLSNLLSSVLLYICFLYLALINTWNYLVTSSFIASVSYPFIYCLCLLSLLLIVKNLVFLYTALNPMAGTVPGTV